MIAAPRHFTALSGRLRWDPAAVDLAADARAWPSLPAALEVVRAADAQHRGHATLVQVPGAEGVVLHGAADPDPVPRARRSDVLIGEPVVQVREEVRDLLRRERRAPHGRGG